MKHLLKCETKFGVAPNLLSFTLFIFVPGVVPMTWQYMIYLVSKPSLNHNKNCLPAYEIRGIRYLYYEIIIIKIDSMAYLILGINIIESNISNHQERMFIPIITWTPRKPPPRRRPGRSAKRANASRHCLPPLTRWVTTRQGRFFCFRKTLI